MRILLQKINELKKQEIGNFIDKRLSEFREMGNNSEEIFGELCYCLLTANFNAKGAMKIQKEMKEDFFINDKEELSKKLKIYGHRFPNVRAKYIFEAQKYKNDIKNILDKFNNGREARKWLVENIKGLGMKEASHFLRNIGYDDVAIIDFHIIDLMVKEELIEKPKFLNPKKYVEIENILSEIAKKSKINLDELDLYLWYMETGKVLK